MFSWLKHFYFGSQFIGKPGCWWKLLDDLESFKDIGALKKKKKKLYLEDRQYRKL